jgi:hypothetical protein
LRISADNRQWGVRGRQSGALRLDIDELVLLCAHEEYCLALTAGEIGRWSRRPTRLGSSPIQTTEGV